MSNYDFYKAHVTTVLCLQDKIEKLEEENRKLKTVQPLQAKHPFTPRIRQIVKLAEKAADELGHNYIGSEHLLSGLAKIGDGVAHRAMIALGSPLDSEKLREAIIGIVGRGDKTEATR